MGVRQIASAHDGGSRPYERAAAARPARPSDTHNCAACSDQRQFVRLLAASLAMEPELPSVSAISVERDVVNAAVRQLNATIFFVHVPHTGGTTMCALAREAGMRTVLGFGNDCHERLKATRKPLGGWRCDMLETCNCGGFSYTTQDAKSIYGKNCNVYHVDSAQALGSQGTLSMLDWARHQHLDFLPIETIRPIDLPWGQFAMLAIVRHPLHRFLSKCDRGGQPWLVNNRTRYESLPAGSIRACMCSLRGYQLMQLAGCPGGGTSSSCHARTLHGQHQDVFSSVTRSDVRSASLFLERASVVLVTDLLSESSPILRHVFGWAPPHDKSRTHLNAHASSVSSPAFAAELFSMHHAAHPSISSERDRTGAMYAALKHLDRPMHDEFVAGAAYELAVYDYAAALFDRELAEAALAASTTAEEGTRQALHTQLLERAVRAQALAPHRNLKLLAALPEHTSLGCSPEERAAFNSSQGEGNGQRAGGGMYHGAQGERVI